VAIPQEKIRRRYAAEEYLELERAAEYRREFLDGQILAMAGESLSHSRICINPAIEAGSVEFSPEELKEQN
jgi:Uma2 family endonuclease